MENYDRFLSKLARQRVPDPLIAADEVFLGSDEARTSYINVAGGLPHNEIFPICDIICTLRDGSILQLGEATTAASMNYSPARGIHTMARFCQDLVAHFHSPPCLNKENGTNTVVSPGSSDAIEKVLSLVLNPGDYILTEEYTYAGATALIQSMELKPLLLEMDGKGIKPDSLRHKLSRWKPEDARNPDSDIPKLLYVVPNGQNPTGATMPLSRKREIYQICRKYDVLIFEDDPYCLLSEKLIPSFLSLDEDGRVMRADSFSKVLGAGFRCGYMTGPEPLIAKWLLHAEVSTSGSSSLSQMVLLEIFKKWGFEGYLDHARKATAFYRERREAMLHVANKWVKDYLDWEAPSCGMFLWMKSKHLEDTMGVCEETGHKKKVLFCPGSAFSPVRNSKSPYIRASFSYVAVDKMEAAFKALAELLRESMGAEP